MCMKLQLLCIQLYVGRQIAVACSRPLVAHVYSFSQCSYLDFRYVELTTNRCNLALFSFYYFHYFVNLRHISLGNEWKFVCVSYIVAVD